MAELQAVSEASIDSATVTHMEGKKNRAGTSLLTHPQERIFHGTKSVAFFVELSDCRISGPSRLPTGIGEFSTG